MQSFDGRKASGTAPVVDCVTALGLPFAPGWVSLGSTLGIMARRLQNSIVDLRPGAAWSPYLAVLLFALALSAPAFPADAQPDLEFRPATVNLPAGTAQSAIAMIVLHNRSDAGLRNLRLSWSPRPELDIHPTTPLTLAALAPHADYVWTLAITASHASAPPSAAVPSAMARPGGPEAGAFTAIAPPFGPQLAQIDENLDLRLDYETVAGGKTSPQVILKSLPVKTENLNDLDKILDVQIKTTLASLDSSQWGSIYLVLKNTSPRTFNIVNIAPIGSGVSYCQESRVPLPYGSLPFCFYSSLHSLTLGPHQTAIEEFPVKGHTRVKPGTYLLVFHIVTQSPEGGAPALAQLDRQPTGGRGRSGSADHPHRRRHPRVFPGAGNVIASDHRPVLVAGGAMVVRARPGPLPLQVH